MATARVAQNGNGQQAPAQQERDQTLRRLLRPDEMVWLVEEAYDPVETTWRVDLVRQNRQGQWMRQRYVYDVPRQIVYFKGERPISDAERAKIRREARVFQRPA
ncbi:MAG: hypothetical protein HC837_12925 [Chloroflexaceae bacterium]|nr:hypothetical protein [Chloroflexaceae bacterium]